MVKVGFMECARNVRFAMRILSRRIGFIAATATLLAVGIACDRAKPVGSTGRGGSGDTQGEDPASCREFCSRFNRCHPENPGGEEIESVTKMCIEQCEQTPPPPDPEGKLLVALRKCAARPGACSVFHVCAENAFKKLAAELEPPAEDPDAVYNVPLEKAPSVGAEHGLVTIVGFLDLGCGFCTRAHVVMREMLSRHGNNLRIVYRDFPLGSRTGISFKAAEAAYSVYEQKGKLVYWNFQKKVFDEPKMNENRLLELAQEAGADRNILEKDLASGKYRTMVEKNIEIGRKFGVEGTPTFFVNGRKIPGFIPLEAFEEVYKALLKEAEELLEKGVARKDIYDHLTRDGETKVKYLEKGGSAAKQESLDPNVTFKVEVLPAHPRKGPLDALVTIVMFGDFECHQSRRLTVSLDVVTKKYPKEVRLFYRNLPSSSHPRAHDAAEASLAVFAQKGAEAFWLFHDMLYQNQDDLSHGALEKLVKTVGVDVAAYRKAMLEHRYRPQLQNDLALAGKLGLNSSPLLFINGKPVDGTVTLDEILKKVEIELAKAQNLVKSGVNPGKLYERIMETASEKPVFR